MQRRSVNVRTVAVVALLQSACQTPAGLPPAHAPLAAAKDEPQQLRPHTVLPEAFSPDAGRPAAAVVVVPPKVLRTATVARPRAEIRQGPGGQFELTDSILTKGTQVIVVNQHTTWRKVIAVPAKGKPADAKAPLQGWVHVQSLSPPEPNQMPVTIAIADLPTVQAVRPLRAVRAYPGDEPLPTAVPKGAFFHVLRTATYNSLVWVPATNSVMWVPRKDVQ